MKKIKRMIAAVLLCVVVLSCAGCVNLKEMKAYHAIWKDEAQTTLELNGETYKKLPDNKYFEIWKYDCFEIWQYDSERVYVTSEDVPVLLAERYGTGMSISKDHTILQSSWHENERPVYYCRADLYEEVAKQMNGEFTFDLMVYDYWDFNIDENVVYTLTTEQKAAVETILKTQPTSLDVDEYAWDYRGWLYRSSKNCMFRELIGELRVFNGEYQIIIYKDFEDLCYSVPAELKPHFDQVVKKYKNEYVDV